MFLLEPLLPVRFHTARVISLDDVQQRNQVGNYQLNLTEPAQPVRDRGCLRVVDSNGRVYEGRYGGPGVIAAHAQGYNSGSIGIAMLGNFQTGAPSDAALKAVENLIVAFDTAMLYEVPPELNLSVEFVKWMVTFLPLTPLTLKLALNQM